MVLLSIVPWGKADSSLMIFDLTPPPPQSRPYLPLLAHDEFPLYGDRLSSEVGKQGTTSLTSAFRPP